jgi:hypothetical protein
MEYSKKRQRDNALLEMQKSKRIDFFIKQTQIIVGKLKNAAMLIASKKEMGEMKAAMDLATSLISELNIQQTDTGKSTFETTRDFDLMLKGMQADVDVLNTSADVMEGVDGMPTTDDDLLKELDQYINNSLELPPPLSPTMHAMTSPPPIYGFPVSPSVSPYAMYSSGRMTDDVRTPIYEYPYTPPYPPYPYTTGARHPSGDSSIIIIDDEPS